MSAQDDLRRQHSHSYSWPRRVRLGSHGCAISYDPRRPRCRLDGEDAKSNLRQICERDGRTGITLQVDGASRCQRSGRRIRPYQEHCLYYLLIQGFLLMLNPLFKVEAMEPVYPEPVFLPWPVNVSVRPGEKAVLPCAVHYLGTKQVTWRKVGQDYFLSVGDQTWVKDANLHLHFNEITPEVTEWNLVIKNATSEHIGTYECRISDLAQLKRYVDLDVSGTPVVEAVTYPPIAVSGKNYVDRGQSIHLFCNTTGPDGTHLKIDWFKDGDRIDYRNYRQVVITNYNLVEKHLLVSELLIDRSQDTDTGTYICRSANGHIDSIKVTVLLAADTNNVKRGYATNEESSSGSVRQCLLHIVLLAVFTSASLTS